MAATQKLIVGRYQIVQNLGTNQIGQTFLAADVHYPGNPLCVVRQLRLPTRNPTTRKFFLNILSKKVEALETIGQHAQITSTFAAFGVGQNYYVVQEFIPGRSLAEEVTSGRPWPKADVIYFLQEILPVFAFAQNHGVFHGNLKPSKIIRRQTDNHLVLLDFGGIKYVSQNVSRKRFAQHETQFSPGSRVYRAPEQLRGKSLSCSDHYALGMIAIQALLGLPTAELPDPESSNAHQATMRLLDRVPALGSELAGILARMVHPNSAKRYQKATEILSDLAPLQETRPTETPSTVHSPIPPAPPMPLETEPPPQGSISWKPVGILALLLLPLIAGAVLLQLPQRILAARHVRAAEVAAANDAERAIAEYTRALALAPENPTALANRSQLYFEIGDTESALSDITRAIELAPNEASYPYDRGNVRLAVGDTQGAIEDYTAAIQANPDFIKAYVNRGSARADWGDDQGAVEDYTTALDLDPPTDVEAAAYLNRCLSYSNLGQQSLALDDCFEAINLRPSHGLAYQNRGLVRRRLGDLQGALQDYNIAIQIDPESPDPYYNRGVTRREMNDLPGAIEDFSTAIALDPTYVFALYDRGLLRAEIGDVSQALSDFRQAAQICLELGRTGCYDDAQYQISQLESSESSPQSR